MKIKFILLFFFSFFFQQTTFAQTSESTDINLQGQVPRIEFESTKYNFGDIYRGRIVSHAFTFENTGNGILLLNSLHAACGCINTKVYSKDGVTLQNSFKPSEGGVVYVQFDSSQFSGNVVRSITAETNMGSSYPTVTLTIMANVQQELFSNPPLLYLGRFEKDAEKTFSININLRERAKLNEVSEGAYLDKSLLEQIKKSPVASALESKILNNKDSFKILAVESTVPNIDVKINPSNNANIYEVQIKVNRNSLPIGPLNAKIIVWNNSTFYKNFEIPLVGEVIGRVEASAKYVEFGVVSDAKASERVITYSSSLKNFAITSVKINLRRLSEMKDLRDGDIFEIKKEKMVTRVGFDPDSAAAFKLHFKLVYPKKLNPAQSLENSTGINVSGNFLVKTNDPDYKEITVPFFGVLRKEP